MRVRRVTPIPTDFPWTGLLSWEANWYLLGLVLSFANSSTCLFVPQLKCKDESLVNLVLIYFIGFVSEENVFLENVVMDWDQKPRYGKIQADKTNDLSKDWHEQHWFYDTSCLNMEIYWDKWIFVLSVIVKKALSWQLSAFLEFWSYLMLFTWRLHRYFIGSSEMIGQRPNEPELEPSSPYGNWASICEYSICANIPTPNQNKALIAFLVEGWVKLWFH